MKMWKWEDKRRDGKTLHALHQGVLIPNNGKIIIVFDFILQYKRTSINWELAMWGWSHQSTC